MINSSAEHLAALARIEELIEHYDDNRDEIEQLSVEIERWEDHAPEFAEFNARVRPRYGLDELLTQCDASAQISAEDQEWLDDGPVGSEPL